MPYRNIACSGATAGDLFTEQHLSGTSRDIAPQLSTAFANGTPSLITVTAGANDTYWQYFIRKCYVSTCGTNTDRTLAAGLLAALQLKFAYALNNISLRSNGQPPRVVLTGYYEPFSAACAQQQTNVTAQELAWLNSQTQAINGVIANAASQHSSFVRYAPVSFSGHELCSANPWVQGLNDAAPFHPTAQGQRVIAQAVTQQAQ
jgi:lysophospholipase L1-like esterase